MGLQQQYKSSARVSAGAFHLLDAAVAAATAGLPSGLAR